MGKLPKHKRRKLQEKLLKKAIAEGRGPEMIKRLKDSDKVSEMPEKHKEIMKQVDEEKGQPRSVKMLNTLARLAENPVRYIQDLFSHYDPPSDTKH